MRRVELKSSVVSFLLVGCSAAAVHLLVVFAFVNLGGISALWANPLGFLTAFTVSYFGHSRWTFPLDTTQHGRAVRRFFVLATTGFALNQTAFNWGLGWVGQQFYLPLLAVVMIFVAAATFVLSKLWAFADAHHPHHAPARH